MTISGFLAYLYQFIEFCKNNPKKVSIFVVTIIVMIYLFLRLKKFSKKIDINTSSIESRYYEIKELNKRVERLEDQNKEDKLKTSIWKILTSNEMVQHIKSLINQRKSQSPPNETMKVENDINQHFNHDWNFDVSSNMDKRELNKKVSILNDNDDKNKDGGSSSPHSPHPDIISHQEVIAVINNKNLIEEEEI